MTELVLATDRGLYLAKREDGTWRPQSRHLESHAFTCVLEEEGLVLAGTTNGLYRSTDRGTTWQEASAGLTVRHVRWLASHRNKVFAGTEPAGIFVSHDGARSWRACPEVTELRDKFGWYLPYSPEAGCVRSFAFHGARGYAAVEVGGVLRSDDGGETWRLAGGSTGEPHIGAAPAEPSIHPDVHSVEVHPSSAELVIAATNAGLYRSEDGGEGWTRISSDVYTRAFWYDPSDPDHLIYGPATRADWDGYIEESRDGGRSWRMAAQGLEAPWEGAPIERFTQVGDELLAVRDDGRVLAASLGVLAWRFVLEDVSGVNALTALL